MQKQINSIGDAAKAARVPNADALGSIHAVSGYQITQQLYAGSRTLVYRATREANSQQVILKLLRNEMPTFSELVQFRNQYAIMRGITEIASSNTAIIQPYSLEPFGNGYVLVMEDFGGISLSQFTQGNPLEIATFLELAIQLTDILHHLYQQRVIHKDIKPANVLIHPDTKQVKLIDFSISSLLPRESQEIQNPNVLEGTLAYLSPEQTGRMNRGIDYRSDFYSLGVTFYQLLAGQLPFQSDDPMELVHSHLAVSAISAHQVNPKVPAALSRIVAKLMAKNAEDRYQSAMGLKHDLENCLQQWNETGTIAQFAIAQQDRCDRFTIPEKLYGRETEVAALLAAFDRVANPPDGLRGVELMLVAGFSGIGKTAAVNEVHKPIVRQRGYFIKGKYDQFQRNIPFSAFVQSFRDLMAQLLGESKAQLEKWRTKILQAVGENGQVIIDVIPELERIIGKQPPVPELSGSAAQNRFNLLFQNFLQVFTAKEHPLVMFLDDLQWADSASLNLLKLLLSETETGYLLLLGAYRDNEVFPAHPLMLTLEEIKKAAATINTITLAPLNRADINQLVADTLNCSKELAQPLTDLVYQKTKGNPFFATQFLKALYSDRLITFNYQENYWECNLAQVKAAALTDDVMEFMAAQLQKLPEQTQEMLKLAACIGNIFDLATLAIVSEKLPVDAAADLWKALQEGLILPISETYKFFQSGDRVSTQKIAVPYRFLHDRVQQAADSLIPENQKAVIHLKIGQLLLQNSSTIEREEKLFDIVGHLNQGQDLIIQSSERHQLIQLNLQAGYKAKRSTAYSAASNYLACGIHLLADNGWEQHYQLMFTLHRERAEVAYLNSDFEQSEALINQGLNKAQSILDKAEFYHFLIVQYSIRGNYAAAIQTSIHALNLLGVQIDRATLKSDLDREFEEIKQRLGERPIASLLDLPEMNEPEKRMILQLLIDLDPPTYITADLDLYILSSVKAVNLSIKYGNVPGSAKAYANYGFIAGAVLGDYKSGYEFGVLALNLTQKFNHMGQKCQVCLLLGSWLSVWFRPIAGTAAINLEGYQAGLSGGESQFAGYNLFGNICNQIFQGVSLDLIWADIQDYFPFAERTQNQLLADLLIGVQLFIEALFAPSTTASHPVLSNSDRSFIEQCQSAQTLMALSVYYICQMQLACIQGNFAQGLANALDAQPLLNSVLGFTTSASYYFYPTFRTSS